MSPVVLALAIAVSTMTPQWTYEHAAAAVRRSGWSCVQVNADRPEHAFAYSVGLAGKHLPELGMFGVDDTAVACAAIDRVARVLVAGRHAPPSGAEVFRNADGRVILRAVLRKQFFERCALARRWRDEHHVADARAMQILVLAPGEPIPR